MQTIGMRAMARRIVDFGRDRKTRLYYAACVVLLVAAAGLRFHDLSEKSLEHDEVVAANNSSGALSEVVPNTRRRNSSPILYPLVLWAVQQVESTAFSVRVVPATASVLTIAVMLFLLPRLGVARGAAFLAALLATLSTAAIEHAQDAREYSIDALLAMLMLAGLLWYLRDGRKALLCVSLFLAPLLQYGLVLFGVAVIGAAVVAPRVSGQERRSTCTGRLPIFQPLATIRTALAHWMSFVRNQVGEWLKRRLDLAAPCGFFLAGGTLSYLVTLRYQWEEGGFASDRYLLWNYYQGNFDAYSIFEFSIDGVYALLTYHLPEIAVIAALAAFAILLVAAFLVKLQGKFQASTIVVVFSFCIAISAGAAVLRIYPLGGIRQGIYLGPIVFLAVGVAFHWIAGCLSSLTRRGWTMPALLVAIAGTTVLAGVSTMRHDSSPQKLHRITVIVNYKSALAVLKERVRKEDFVYLGRGGVVDIRSYLEEETPANYHYGNSGWCGRVLNSCLRETADLAYWHEHRNGRIWFVTWQKLTALESNMPGISVKEVVSDRLPGLYLIEDTAALINRYTTDVVRNLEAILTRKPSIRSTFDVHLTEDMLIYVKEPCGAEDMQEIFFLHVVPVDVNGLPEHRKQYGFDNLDFRFNGPGVRSFRSAERCIVLRELPDYDFTAIHTGQYLVRKDGSTAHLWEGEIRVDE